MSYGADVHWKFRTPITTWDLVSEHVVPLQELVAWSVQRPVTVTAAYLRVQPDGEWLEWRRRWRKASATNEETRAGNTRFFASDLAPTFADGLQRWLEVLRQSQEAIDLMVSLLFAAPEYVDTDLLLVAQSLEAYHRATLQRSAGRARYSSSDSRKCSRASRMTRTATLTSGSLKYWSLRTSQP